MEGINDRQKDFPWMSPQDIIVIGAGGIGSWTAMLLARIGHNIQLFDMDTVESHNIGGQLFSAQDVGSQKTSALSRMIHSYCPGVTIDTFGEYSEYTYSSHTVILAVDNMKVRKTAVDMWHQYQLSYPDKTKPNILIDGRLEGEQGIIYALDSVNDIERWRKEWFPDEKIPDGPCTMRSTSYNGAMMAANIVAILNNKIANKKCNDDIREVPYKIEYGFPGFVYDVIA